MNTQNKSVFTGKIIKISDRSNNNVRNITLAVTSNAKDSKGNDYERTDYPSIVLWDDLARMNLAKGDYVEIDARFQTRSYKSKGETRYVSEFVALSTTKLAEVAL